jgi:NAD(P)-dependent dehydrogenase (short-subunit alcohol dehydrogenase family)
MKQIDKHAYGPRALVTGASSGIGEEFARRDAAIAFAQRIPATRFGATVEVRPILER